MNKLEKQIKATIVNLSNGAIAEDRAEVMTEAIIKLVAQSNTQVARDDEGFQIMPNLKLKR